IVCDKPLGVSLAEYDTAVAAAATHGVALGINLVLRHHGLYRALHGLALSRVLGAPRRLAVENYADEAIGFGHEHWLWDPVRSGAWASAADIPGWALPPPVVARAYEVHTWARCAGERGARRPRPPLPTVPAGGRVPSVSRP